MCNQFNDDDDIIRAIKEIFGEFFDDSEIHQIIQNAQQIGYDHPIIDLAKNTCMNANTLGEATSVTENTKSAFKQVIEADDRWKNGIKRSLCSKDRPTITGALGESRCYGVLSDVFGRENVEAVPTRGEEGLKTNDLKIHFGGAEVDVEVKTMEMSDSESKKLDKFIENEIEHSVSGGANVLISKPCDANGGHDDVQKMINKIDNLKENSEQLTGAKQSILWIDLQNNRIAAIWEFLAKNGPYFSGYSSVIGCEGIFTNFLWESIYGKKGDRIFFGESLDKVAKDEAKIHKNSRWGRFMKTKGDPSKKRKEKFKRHAWNVSAVVFYAPQAIILYENPFAKKKIADEVVKALTASRHFKIEISRINFPDKRLKKKLKEDRKTLKKMGKQKCYFY